MDCNFIEDQVDKNKKTCIFCGRIFISHFPPNKIHLHCEKSPIRDKDYIPPAMPPVIEQIKNAAIALGDFVNNPDLVQTDEYTRRMNICLSCDKYDEKNNRCGVCGCYLSLKAKGAAFHCPLKKWPGDK